MKGLQVFILASVALLQFHEIVGSPILHAGQIPVESTEECRIEIMNEVEHKTFYDYCYSFEGSEVNIPRNSVYFTKNELYSISSEAVLDFFTAFNDTSTPVSSECLALLQPFICFYYFKFPISTEDCSAGYVPPCTDLCESTHDTCAKDFESMVQKGLVKPKDLNHLNCINFKQNTGCIKLPATPTKAAATDNLATDAPVTDSPVTVTPTKEDPPVCNCAKKVRQNVTKRMMMDPAHTLAAQISVLAMREEGEGAEKHVVYDVTVLKEYQISCRPPLDDDTTTTIHMETPMACLQGDYGCRAMTIGKDHRYLVVGTTTSDGKWLLKDSKGSGGCAISEWSRKYDDKIDKWASKALPSESTCTTDSRLDTEN